MAPRHLFNREMTTERDDSSSTVSTTVTVIRTTVRWVEPSSTLKRVPSPSQPRPASFGNSEDGFTRVRSQKAGSQPADRNPASLAPPALSISHAQAAAFATLDLSDYLTGSPKSSTPSYPLTLYDQRTVATSQAAAASDHDVVPYKPFRTMEGAEFSLTDIPMAAQILLFACLGAGAIWSILVWRIKSRTTTQSVPQMKEDSDQKEGRKAWWNCVKGVQRAHKGKQEPKHKSSDYAPLHSASSSTSASNDDIVSTPATSSATPDHAPIRLRKINTGASRTPLSSALPPWDSSNGNTNALLDHHSQDHDTTNTVPDSPVNPFLAPSRTPTRRSSSEYLATHRAFFTSLPRTPPPGTTPQLSPYPSRSISPVSELDALEAQYDAERPRSRGSRGVLQIAEGVEKTLGAQVWTGRWLEVVEGGVHKAVNAVVRWTEDDGGKEGLLLPVGNESR
ncbi:hypothetical protein BU23DRAFT_240613 [Bimuria novae-zelandiae CBS 107.79]|uniref:Uncharacterized protein n=1 Tax=Bimuria novae-zelandiae CBS 107.79 TaxID=1447943 RepID=A0A6A5UY85_9PLEO|nr:hypothetical protein BU23DRAFT_240613 [Bimuria novae-zelandiae CBS 107.79]